MSSPKAQPYLANLETYIGGKRKLNDGQTVIKLSSNENPNGPSPKALEAYQSASTSLHRYPEDGALTLREALAAHHSFGPDQLIIGAGSDDVIRMLCQAYGGAGRSIVYSQHGFAMYRIYGKMSGAQTISAPESNLRVNVDKVLAAVTPDTSIVFLANPNNPTGSYLTHDELRRLRAELREDVILALDGAYAEYMTADDYSDGRELVETTNTVLMRTFSKAYGLSTLRIGWGYGPKSIIDMLYKVRSPFNVTQPSLDAALTALTDQDYLAAHVKENNAERLRMESALSAMGIGIHPSHANFVLAAFTTEPERNAQAANTFLQSRGIIVREVANYDLPHCLRISIGTHQENDALLEALADFTA